MAVEAEEAVQTMSVRDRLASASANDLPDELKAECLALLDNLTAGRSPWRRPEWSWAEDDAATSQPGRTEESAGSAPYLQDGAVPCVDLDVRRPASRLADLGNSSLPPPQQALARGQVVGAHLRIPRRSVHKTVLDSRHCSKTPAQSHIPARRASRSLGVVSRDVPSLPAIRAA